MISGIKLFSWGWDLPLRFSHSKGKFHDLRVFLLSSLTRPFPPAAHWMSLLGLMSPVLPLVPGLTTSIQTDPAEPVLGQPIDDRNSTQSPGMPPHTGTWYGGWRTRAWGRVSPSATVLDLLYTNASTVCWGASLLQESVSGLCDAQERSLHYHVLELRAIYLGL